jgi:hypothetical protein
MSKLSSISLLVVAAACGSSSSSSSSPDAASPAIAACQAVGSAYCGRAYACLTPEQLAAFQLPPTEAGCVTQENASCTGASPEPGFCKGTPQTSAQAATACAADLNGQTCAQFTGSASGSDVCKTQLCQ